MRWSLTQIILPYIAAGDGRTGDPVLSFLFRKCWKVIDFPVLLLSLFKTPSLPTEAIHFLSKNRNNITGKRELGLEIWMACLFLIRYTHPTREFPDDLF